MTGLDGRFSFLVESGVAYDLLARARLATAPPGEIESDPDDAHAGRMRGVLGGGAELVLTLPK